MDRFIERANERLVHRLCQPSNAHCHWIGLTFVQLKPRGWSCCKPIHSFIHSIFALPSTTHRGSWSGMQTICSCFFASLNGIMFKGESIIHPHCYRHHLHYHHHHHRPVWKLPTEFTNTQDHYNGICVHVPLCRVCVWMKSFTN